MTSRTVSGSAPDGLVRSEHVDPAIWTAVDTSQRAGVVYVNGYFRPGESATLTVFDHATHYGDGVFETVAQRSGYLFHLDGHLTRLYRSAAAIDLTIPFPAATMAALVKETIARNGLTESYTKILVTRGAGTEPLMDHVGLVPSVVIIPRQLRYTWETEGSRGLRFKIVHVQKNAHSAVDPRVKSLSYLNNVLARIEAVNAGFDDALQTDSRGRVVEGSIFNLFLVSDGVLYQPHEGFLDGITRQAVEVLATELAIDVRDKPLYPYDLYTADELFVCNTSRGITPVVDVDGRTIGPGVTGPITNQLKESYLSRAREGWHGTAV